MTRQQLINNVIAEIAKEENISEQEVTTYSVMLRLADMQVKFYTTIKTNNSNAYRRFT